MPMTPLREVIPCMRMIDDFWHITKKPFMDRFWNWWSATMLESWQRNDDVSLIEGNVILTTPHNKFFYEVRSREIDVPLMLMETQFSDGPHCYMLQPMRKPRAYHLTLHQDWVYQSRLRPTHMPFEWVSYAKMKQLAQAGSTPAWVQNKMLGMYDGEAD